jgi:hypothetical protein
MSTESVRNIRDPSSVLARTEAMIVKDDPKEVVASGDCEVTGLRDNLRVERD